MSFVRLCVILSSLVLCCCGHERTPVEVIRKHIGKHVVISDRDSVYDYSRGIACTYGELTDAYDYFSLVYVDNTCAVCRATLVEWVENADMVGKIAPDDYAVLFIYRGENPREYIEVNFGDVSRFPFYILPYEDFRFLLSNDISDDVLDASVLIDRRNEIRLVGEPFASEKMEALYRGIMDGGDAGAVSAGE